MSAADSDHDLTKIDNVEQINDSTSSNEEEDVYSVERLCDHKYIAAKKSFKYLVKWEGYPESDNTWEDEENIMSEALLKQYWDRLETQGITKESIMNPSAKLKKRTSMANKTPTSSVKDPKKRHISSGANSSDNNLISNSNSIPDDFPPEDESWEDLVDKIDTVDRTPDNGLVVYIEWKNGKKTVHPSSVINLKCPQKIIKFYEERLRFSSVAQDD
ncbi:Chromatin-associated protein swi6 [Smittium culicis]|uniref:Chromatin-associated protein swi6 n=1 Tax=Smittium culicis TaxID=133412 RepID=A0A1R1YAG6_9FUNG|nr:Chromatin-associated protein swi6 [Smittium culicis]